MSGGQLVVMDRLGRDVKRYSLPEGLVTLGSDPDCDIRVMLPVIKQQHATVVVHANQTIVRNISDGETLVNGHAVSVAALRHGDVITLGDRSLRWEYYEPTVPRPLAPEPALHTKRKTKNRTRKRTSEVTLRRIEPTVRLALEMKHRASMPGATKQVAIVQPQRRDDTVNVIETKTRLITKPHRPYIQSKKAQCSSRLSTPRESRNSKKRMTRSDQNTSHVNETEVHYSSVKTDISVSDNKSNTRGRKMKSPRNVSSRNSQNAIPKQRSNVMDDKEKMYRKSKTISTPDSPKNRTPKNRTSKSIMNMSSNALLENSTETKASQWIASRKTSPRKTQTPRANEMKATKYVHVATPRPKEPYIEMSPSKMIASSTPTKVVLRRSTPLRNVVLKKMVTPNDRNRSLVLSAKKSQSTPKVRVQKIEEPLYLDDNKKAALMLLTRTPKSKINVKLKTPVLAIKKPSPVKVTPNRERKSRRISKEVKLADLSCMETSGIIDSSNKRTSRGKNITRNNVTRLTDVPVSNLSLNYQSGMIDDGALSPFRNQIVSPPLPSPKKSAMKDPSARRNPKKIESIKFDLSNIESSSHSEVVPKASGSMYDRSNIFTGTEEDLTLRYSESPPPTPSPRRPIHSRSSKIMEKTLGETFSINSSDYDSTSKSATPSLNPRKSLRSTLIVEKALSTPQEGINPRISRKKSQRLTIPLDTSSKGKVSKTRSLNNMETYSIVDLVSLNTSETGSVIDLGSAEVNESAISSSIYDSLASNSRKSIPRRKTYSLTPTHIGSSTPYAGRTSPRKSLLSKTTSETVNLPVNNTSVRKSKSLLNVSYRSSRGETKSADSNTSVEYTGQGDTFTITSSPQSTSRKTRSSTTIDMSNLSMSKNSKSLSPRKKKSKQSGNKNSFIAQDSNWEPGTPPESTIATSEPSTPILNIQHLLDSSNVSVKNDSDITWAQRRSSKRQTVGQGVHKGKRTLVTRTAWSNPERGTRLSRVSKRNSNAAKGPLQKRISKSSSSISNKIDKTNPDDGEEKVTPKSNVKLVQPGVKEIHSTAKKPVSKRSIIDDLSQSVIVKQLFNSPVKRKLSQSMTEFSKTEFTEDGTTRGRRRRTTVGLSRRTPNQSLDLENVDTPQVPTEIFVSPMSTPQQSPKLDGLKRLFLKSTPDNDLRNISGVKRLLRTPRKQTSPRNDLNNVIGVKETFSKRSPTNDLRDVTGVKHLYGVTKSKTRLSGVRSLFQLDRSRKSPKNDLTDVQGVKRLFTAEEFKLQQKRSKGNVTLTKGKKETSRFDSDFSGLDELFAGPSRIQASPNSAFDKLLDKPQVKAAYSKSYRAKSKTPSKRSKTTQSFHEPIDFTSVNVEKWLERELIRKTHKDASVVSEVQGRETKNVSISRELQRLTTATVEGKTPVLKSRVRNSTVIKSVPRKSAEKRISDLDRNSLPIKKRSLVNVSRTPKEKMVHRKSSLPIKKRAIVHSTPVGNKHTFISHVSDLERVSPIIVDKREADQEVFHLLISVNTPVKEISTKSKQKSPGKRNQKMQTNRSPAPERNRTKRSGAPKLSILYSPKVTRTRRGAKVVDSGVTRSVRKSLVLTKKPPIMSPQVIPEDEAKPRTLRRRGGKTKTDVNIQEPNTSRTGKVLSIKSTKKTQGRTTRANKEHDISKDVIVKNQRETKTRARNKRNSLTPAIVVTKPSPKMKPQSKKTASKKIEATKKTPIQQKRELRKRTGKTANEEEKTDKPIGGNQRITKKRENVELNIQTPKTTRRGRNTVTAKKSPRNSVPKQETTTNVRTLRTVPRNNVKNLHSDNSEELKGQKQSKGKKRVINDTAVPEEEVVPRKTRRTRVLAADAVPEKRITGKIKTKETTEQIERKTKGRTRKVAESPRKTRSGNVKKDTSNVVQEQVSRGRKRNVEVTEPATSGKGRKSTKQAPAKKPREMEKKEKQLSPAKTRATRSQKKVLQDEGAGSKRRGRK